jgi:neopullulanase
MKSSAALALGVMLLCACSRPTIPPGYNRDCRAIVFWEPGEISAPAFVVGDFNDWTPGELPLSDEDGDGIYSAVIETSYGFHQYRIQADSETYLDKFNPLTLFDAGGRENSAVLIPDCTKPALQLDTLETNPDGSLLAAARFLRAGSSAAMDIGSVSARCEDGLALDIQADNSPGDISISASSLSSGKHRLIISASDRLGSAADDLSVPFWIEDTLFDWHDAVIYQVMIDRFRRAGGDLDHQAGIADFHGGDLDGLREAIESGYFEKLGVNVLWLSPLYENPEGEFMGRDGYPSHAYHGYWPSEPRSVESRFGGAEALERLVSAAHARGIRLLADAVPNHVCDQHPYWKQHQADGWFNHPDGDCICGMSCPWSTSIEECWFTSFLPDLSFAGTEEVEQVVDDLLFWIDRFDLDGLRIDAVPMMPRLVIRQLRAALGRGPEAGPTSIFLLGETYTERGGQPIIRYYLGPNGLSGQFDFPVMWALRDGLAGRISMRELDDEVRASAAAWEGSGAVMAPILGNHDVARFVSDMNGDQLWQPRTRPAPVPDRDKPYDLLKIAWTFLLTQPGAPVIYYGDEIGLPGASDPDNRREMHFDSDLSARESAVLEHVRRLGQARTCSKALRRGLRRTLLVNDNLYIYARDAGDGFPAVVVMSRASVPRALTIMLPDDISLDSQAAFADLFGATVSATGRSIELSLAPRGSAVLLAESTCLESAP